ncbi:uncharacterized protein LOC123670358 [Melitaea cinxia]|uniref:uncharacterized protein LOC123670358 n=1 Tax=Melitaea cinxia TaxID=113334 RepID=UPI001E274870|nr:uncharacterized protein LOC123670358 [Melitaea cinxia]
MISVMHRLLTSTHTMKSFVALFIVVTAVAVNAVPVEKDAAILKQDVEVQPQNYAIETRDDMKGQDSGYVKNVGAGEHPSVTPAPQPMPYYIIPVTDYIKPPEKKIPVLKE